MRKTTTTNAEAQAIRTRNPEWGFFGACKANGHADPDAAWNKAIRILTEPLGRFRFEPEVARDLLDSPWGRHLADDCVGLEIEDVIEGNAVERRWMKSLLTLTRAIVMARADDGR